MNNRSEIRVERGQVVEKPFEISDDTAERIWIFEPNSKATVIVHDSGNGMTSTDIVVEDGADVEVIEIVERSSDFTSNYTVTQKRDSRYRSTVIDFSEGKVRRMQTVTLADRGAECWLGGLYIAMNEADIENSVKVIHAISDCRSNQLFKGVIGGSATTLFNGTIYVDYHAVRTAAFQENHNILLSDTAHAYTRPQLEIYADDVKCSHGATVGRLDPEAIFYMRQRGIGVNEAMRLQLVGFAGDVVERIGYRDIIEGIENRIEKILIQK